jgi:redox-sensitive bicupin YhaK (pirin superfamily)
MEKAMRNEIDLVIEGRSKDIGIPVTRVLPFVKRRTVGPFIFLDHMGPKHLIPPFDHLDVRPHPHIGLSTLTYLFEGELLHRDSLGSVQLIVPGEVNWMTAGKGVSHSERETPEARKRERETHGLQFWVALPLEHEDVEPSFLHYKPAVIPVLEQDSYTIKVIAGECDNQRSPLKTYSPMTFLVMTAKKEGTFKHEREGHEHALFIVKGEIKIDGKTYGADHMIVFVTNSTIEVEHSEDALFVLIGGEPFPEPRHIWWNFVSSSKEKIEKAKLAWNDRTFPQVPDEVEWIPAPNDLM